MNRRLFLWSASSACSLAAFGRAFAIPQPESALQKRVRAQLNLGVEEELTVGAVALVAQQGLVKVLEATGYADRESRKPMSTDAIFDIRSISKPITVLGALLLVQEGKLKLDDSLANMLPEFSHLSVAGQNQPVSVPITIQQLMTHTSGIAAERPAEIANITRTFDHTLAQAVALTAKQPWIFFPAHSGLTAARALRSLGGLSKLFPASRSKVSWGGASSSRWACRTLLFSATAPKSVAFRLCTTSRTVVW